MRSNRGRALVMGAVAIVGVGGARQVTQSDKATWRYAFDATTT
jgi:hypothetical protein